MTKPKSQSDEQRPATSSVAGGVVDVAVHDENMAERRKEREDKQRLHQRCLDPANAAQQEATKPRHTWRVQVTISRRDDRGRMKQETLSGEYEAQNDSDAWARFCDDQRVSVSRRASLATIEKLEPVEMS